MTQGTKTWRRPLVALVVLVVATACGEAPTFAPVDASVAAFARNKNEGPGSPDGNKSCDNNDNGSKTRKSADNNDPKNSCGGGEPIGFYVVRQYSNFNSSAAFTFLAWPECSTSTTISISSLTNEDVPYYYEACATETNVIFDFVQGGRVVRYKDDGTTRCDALIEGIQYRCEFANLLFTGTFYLIDD